MSDDWERDDWESGDDLDDSDPDAEDGAEDEVEKAQDVPVRDGLRFWDADWAEDHDAEAIAITSSRLIHRKFDKSRHTKAFRKAIEAGESLEDAFGKKAKSFPLSDIRRVRHVEADEEVRIEYRGHEGKGKIRIGGGDGDPHTEVFADVTARVAPGMLPLQTRLSLWEAVRGPLFYLGVVLFCGAVLAGVLKLYENDPDGPSGLKAIVLFWVADLLGWWGIYGLTGASALGVVWWLVSRVREPPVVFEIRLP